MKNMKEKTLYITKTAVLLALVTVAQFALSYVGKGIPVLNTIVVGSAVNLILFLAVKGVGLYSGIFIGALTPVMALAIGKLALPILIPFVAIGNIILVLVVYGVDKLIAQKYVNASVSIILSSLLKFFWMWLMVSYVVAKLPGVKPPMVKAMQIAWNYPQFVAALIGGIIAYVIIHYLPSSFRAKYKTKGSSIGTGECAHCKEEATASENVKIETCSDCKEEEKSNVSNQEASCPHCNGKESDKG